MNNMEVLNVLDLYYTITASLKNKKRQGWVYWNVAGTRVESIAEHIFGAQQLAWALYSESGISLDIFKVIAMLSLHETEEVIIGDITPYDGISPEEKLKMGHEAVKKLMGNCQKSEMMMNLISEFDARITPEAKFAHLCDKLECDLQIKKYSDAGYCSIENACIKVKEWDDVKASIANGAKTVADIFIAHDEGLYTGTVFEEVVNFLKTFDTTKY